MASQKRSAERESFWRLAFDEFRDSGLSVRAFCEREGLSQPSFYSWRRKLLHRDNAVNGQSRELVEVRVVEPATQDTPATQYGAATRDTPMPDAPATRDNPAQHLLEIVTPGRFILRFPSQIEARQLGAVLNVIAQCKEAVAC